MSENSRDIVSLEIRRDFRRHQWARVGSKHDVQTWNLAAGDLVVKLQFAEWRFGWKDAVERTIQEVQLRYSDLPDSVPLRGL